MKESRVSDRFHLFFVSVGISCLAAQFLASSQEADPDLLGHMAFARHVIESLRFPFHDPFPFTETFPVTVNHEWLSGIIFYFLYLIGDGTALVVGKLLAFSLSVYATMVAQRRWSKDGSCSVTLTLFMYLLAMVGWQSTVRAGIFTFIFIPCLFYILKAPPRLYSTRALLPVIFLGALWANLHGGIAIALPIITLFIGIELTLGRVSLAFWGVKVLAALVIGSSFNPYGPWEYWQSLAHAIFMDRSMLVEWQPMSLFSTEWSISILIVGLLLYLFLRAGRNVFLERAPYILFALYAACGAKRHIVLLCLFIAILSGDIFVSYSGRFKEAVRGRLPRLDTALRQGFFLAAVIMGGMFVTATFPTRLTYDRYATGAVDYLLGNYRCGNVLVDFNQGTYLIFKGGDRFKVSLDSRFEMIYPHETFYLVSSALDPKSPRHLESLKAVGADFVLSRRVPDLTESFEEAGYEQKYADEKFSVWVRMEGGGLQLHCSS